MPSLPSALLAGCLLLAGSRLPAQEAAKGDDGVRATLDQAKEGLSRRLFGVQATAFGDALWAKDPDSGRGRLDWGSVELDLSRDLGEDLQSAAALVWTREATLLTVGFLDYHVLGGRIAPRGRLWAEKGFHVQAGRFDVPFGNDWQFFASKDSVSISRPLSTEAVMEGGYNDAGIRVLGSDGTFNFNLYALRGFSQGRLYGGRVGFIPFGNPFALKDVRDGKVAEFGFSALLDRDGSGAKRGSATAWDLEIRGSRLLFRAERLARRWMAWDGEPGRTLRAWRVELEVPLQESLGWPATAFVRAERSSQEPREEGSGDAQDARVTAGFSLNLGRVVQLKLEFQRWTAATPSQQRLASGGGTQALGQLVWVF